MSNLVQEDPVELFYPDFYCYHNDCLGDANYLYKKVVEALFGYLIEKYLQLYAQKAIARNSVYDLSENKKGLAEF